MRSVFSGGSPLTPVGELAVSDIPAQAGLYCILARSGSEDFLAPFSELLERRANPLLYIGKAGIRGLRIRLLGEELRGIGPATFFRSLGVVLGHGRRVKPLSPRSRNFSFENRREIVDWGRRHLWIGWTPAPAATVAEQEKALIKEHCPLFNLKDNPEKLAELVKLRADCRRLAHSRYKH